MPSLRFICLGFSVASLLISSGARAEGAYKYQDDKGIWHYSDRLPPEQAPKEREKFKPGSLKKQFEEGAKPPEQRDRENRLKELRAQQERLLAEQRDRDLSLLRTYRSEDDLFAALQGKIQMIDSQIRLAGSNLDRQDGILLRDQQRAADLERRGLQIPKNLRDSIETTRREKLKLQEQIKRLEADKQNMTERFGKDIARFKILSSRQKELEQNVGARGQQQLLAEDKSGGEGIIISAIDCSIGAECDKAWELSRTYVQEHATTPFITETEKILQTANPAEDKDIALTVTRIAGKTKDILFLDVRCRSSSSGEELCRGDTVRGIRADFKPFIEAGLAHPSEENVDGKRRVR